MVDPNRKINNYLTDEDIAYLNECENEFKDRFTKCDEEFMALCNQPLSDPPIVTPWMTDRSKSGSNNYRRNRSANYNQRPYHSTSKHSNCRNNRNEDRRKYKDFNRSSYNRNTERENEKEFSRSDRAINCSENRENDKEFNRSPKNRNNEGGNDKEFMAANLCDRTKSDPPIVMTPGPSKSGSNNYYQRNHNGNHSHRPYHSRSNQSIRSNRNKDRGNDKVLSRSPNGECENDKEFNQINHPNNDEGENDKEFMASNHCEQPESNPPIVKPWMTSRPSKSGSNNYYRRNRSPYRSRSNQSNRSSNRNETRENDREFSQSPYNRIGERENEKEFNRSDRPNNEGENDKEFMASNHRDQPKLNPLIVKQWMTSSTSRSGSNDNYYQRNRNHFHQPYLSRSHQSNCPNNRNEYRENDREFSRSPNNRIGERENDKELNRCNRPNNDEDENDKQFMASNRRDQPKLDSPIGIPKIPHRPGNSASNNYQRTRYGNCNQQGTYHNRSHRDFRQNNRNYYKNVGRRSLKRHRNDGNNNSGRNNDGSNKH